MPGSSFLPPPQVESAVVRLTALAADKQPQPADRRLYLKLIENVFRHRRKNMQNALHLAFSHLEPEQVANVLAAAGIDPALRAQDLAMDDFVRLADRIAELIVNQLGTD